MKLCDYGCGNEALFFFPSVNKWCCSDNWTRCPTSRKRRSKLLKGKRSGKDNPMYNKKHTTKSKQKIGKSKIGKPRDEQTKKKLSDFRKGKTYEEIIGFEKSEKAKERISKAGIGRIPWNKSTISKIKKKYPTFAKAEQMRYNPDKPGEKEIQVHCKNHNCPNSKEQGGWFTPTGNQFDGRRRALEKEYGNDGNYFYCSENCKKECPLFRLDTKIETNIDKEQLYTTEEYNTWRKEVLKRANNLCEYCGQPAEHCHHIEPQKLQPELSLDPENGLACCKECHYKYGHKDECSTGHLSNIVCTKK